ncbi:carbohydate-binding domain-containing protein [Pseudoalteromonas tunicata]|uniref:family 20 glycosylhydrolase n=1 Tax=Pseudoalteromonas tunicata TaxID=314281 RepID=UPI00273D11E5|nr:family 20 glycosylhydrolase [Pseudoalteromonas tunicata]MDP5215078.1 carbohydate-binding domain-containing protein [Pseudoalteromonas tunicata]
MIKSTVKPISLAIGLVCAAVAPNAFAALSGSDIKLDWHVIDHGIGENIFLGSLTIHNNGIEPLTDSGWALYFNSVRPPASVLPASDANGERARAALALQNVSIDNADSAKSGDYFVLKPTAGFNAISPGESRKIEIIAQYWQMLKNDSPGGFHLVVGNQAPQAVLIDVHMDPNDPKQTTQTATDIKPVQTPQIRYLENQQQFEALAVKNRLVPQPLTVQTSDAHLNLLSHQVQIVSENDLLQEAQYLQAALKDLMPGQFAIHQQTTTASSNQIRLQLDPSLNVDSDSAPDNEGYMLIIDPFNGITITGKDAAGVFYGIQTLRQLIPKEVYAASVTATPYQHATLPATIIKDAPRFEYRGMMLDVARNFQSKETVLKLIDLLALYKINQFEMNVANDEGWRLEIPGIPELTEFGAKRGFDLNEHTMLHAFMGASNGFLSGDGIENKPANSTEANLGKIPNFQGFEVAQQNFLGQGWGYYTVDDFKEILQYAADRHINVILEYDFPAHARAAIKAMEYRYNKYKDSDLTEAQRYRLIDPLDTSKYYTPQFYTDNFINPALPSAFAFLDKIISETKAMYDAVPNAQVTRLHGGGDELPHLGPNEWWAQSPAVQQNPETAGKTDAQLFDFFFMKWKTIVNKHGFEMAAWGDVLSHNGTGNIDYGQIYPIFWNNVWGWGNEHQAYKFANQGYKVVLSHATNLYLDLAYNKHPDEIGYHWAGYTDTKKAFEYRPFNIYANADLDKLGNPIPWNPNWVDLNDTGKKNVVGIQAQLFAENQKSPEILDYMVFPKLLGAAERAWVQDMPALTPLNQDGISPIDAAWHTFTNTLGQYALPLLNYVKPVDIQNQITDVAGVNFRIPLAGAKIEQGKLFANTRFIGMQVEYSLDEGLTWLPYYQPVDIAPTDKAMVRTKNHAGKTSRADYVMP